MYSSKNSVIHVICISLQYAMYLNLKSEVSKLVSKALQSCEKVLMLLPEPIFELKYTILIPYYNDNKGTQSQGTQDSLTTLTFNPAFTSYFPPKMVIYSDLT